jgi:hypothetical protein
MLKTVTSNSWQKKILSQSGNDDAVLALGDGGAVFSLVINRDTIHIHAVT